MTPDALTAAGARYPARLRERLGDATPAQLTTLGNLDLLALPKTALFCAARCPGQVILKTYDQAAKWRDAGRCVISGFHSPVEQECLRILLRGTPPIILCPARAMPQRIPAEWETPLAEGRLLILSGFAAAEKRVTTELAIRRNALAAASVKPDAFALKVWALKRTKNYGSKHHDEHAMPIATARLSADGRTVTLAVPTLAPTHSYELKLALKAPDGAAIERSVHGTIHALSDK